MNWLVYFIVIMLLKKIVTDDDIYTSERIALLAAIKIVINNAANMLGLILREEM